jgi:glycosyltransferase involved in cell wall biosynthesis
MQTNGSVYHPHMKNDLMAPLVSVIMCVKNGGRFFLSAVESVLSQEYNPLEIIVVDGHSTDQSGKAARAIKGIRYIRQKDHGLANARNLGIWESRGNFIAFLDSDDLWMPGKLSTQMAYLGTHTECLGTVTWLRYSLEPEYYAAHPSRNAHYEQTQVGYTPSTLVARKELFTRVGTFDPAYSMGCDLDWFARLLSKQIPVATIPDILLTKRIHNHNLSLDVSLNRKETMRILKKNILLKRRRPTGK